MNGTVVFHPVGVSPLTEPGQQHCQHFRLCSRRPATAVLTFQLVPLYQIFGLLCGFISVIRQRAAKKMAIGGAQGHNKQDSAKYKVNNKKSLVVLYVVNPRKKTLLGPETQQ